MQEMEETQVQSLGQEDPPGEGRGNPLQYSCLENPMDKGTWQATVTGVTQSWTLLKQFSMQSFMLLDLFYISPQNIGKIH